MRVTTRSRMPAGEQRDVDVRRLQPALAVGHPAGLEGEDRELAGDRLRAGVAAEAGVGRRTARVLGRREAAVRVGLPGLDHRVGDDVAGAVEHPAADPDAALGVPSLGGPLAVGPGQPDRQVRADRRARRGAEPERAGEEAGAALPGARLVRAR